MKSRGGVARPLRPSQGVRRAKGRLGPLPLPPVTTLCSASAKAWMADSIFQVLPTPELEVRPWGSRWPLVWPTPLEVEVGGGVMGGYGCGVGGGGGQGVWPQGCAHSPPLCAKVLAPPPPPGCVPADMGSGHPPPVCQIFPGISLYGGCCMGAAEQTFLGIPPYGGVLALMWPSSESPIPWAPDQLVDTSLHRPPCTLTRNQNWPGVSPTVEVVRMGIAP